MNDVEGIPTASEADDDNDVDDVTEVLEVHNSLKRKADQTNESKLLKVKKVKQDFYKPPTAEEMNNLKETETLFHSSLFRLQINELLAEVKLKDKWKKNMEEWLDSLKEYLIHIPASEIYQIGDQSWIDSESIKVPIMQYPEKVKGTFVFLPPSNIKIVGSYALDISCSADTVIDIALGVPKACWQQSDFLNHRYHRKRALYLAYLAKSLKKCSIIEEMKYSYHHNNHMKPVLLLKPKGKVGKHFTLCLLPYPPKGVFKLNRFIPLRNNVRPSWFFKNDTVDSAVPTPHYNASIVSDIMIPDLMDYLSTKIVSQSVKDGIILLKVWCHQRELDKGYGGFGGFVITMLVAYLLSNRKFNFLMSSYQVFRNTLLTLAKADWTSEAITLCQEQEKNQPTIRDFQEMFDIVFLDSTGFLNICSDVTNEMFFRINHEAQVGLNILDSGLGESFDKLFMNKVPFYRKFDHLIHFSELTKLKSKAAILDAANDILDRGGNVVTAVIPKIAKILRKGLGKRIHLLDIKYSDCSMWPVSDHPPDPSSLRNITFGILLNPEFAFSILDKGPFADNPEAVEFQNFWGEKSELRRFQDGSICEAVVWPGKTISEKRNVLSHIIKHIVKRHAGVDPEDVHYVGNNIDCVLYIPNGMIPSDWLPYGTAEEINYGVIQSFTSLTKELRKLEDLSLRISSIHGISPIFRFCEVFPPVSALHPINKKISAVSGNAVNLKAKLKMAPKWIPPLKAVIHMESSGKWPNDVEAIKRIKAAFYIKIAELLKIQFSLTAVPFPKHVDVLKDGYVFRFQIFCHKEISLMKKIQTSNGTIKIKNTKDSCELECETKLLPTLNSILHGLHQQHNTFGTACRLAKRWISAQLLSDYIKDVTIELLMAWIYINSAPFTTPSSPQVAFLRFLALLHMHDWKTTPLIINMNNELKREDYAEIQSVFTSQRQVLPAMFIATPLDKSGSLWTKETPSQILHRLMLLSKASLETLEGQLSDPQCSDFKQIFRPPLEPYDAFIFLRPIQVPMRYYAIDVSEETRIEPYVEYKQIKDEKLPVVGYDPVQCYLNQLRESFDEFALFFYDTYGGEYIGVIWKPHAFNPERFKVSRIGCRVHSGANSGGSVNIVPNVEAILEDFAILGTGLVKSVERKTDKWLIS